MPYYCYTTEDGETVERFFLIEDRKESIVLDDGRVAHRDIVAEHVGFIDKPRRWPRPSESMRVDPSQIPERMAYLASKGVHCEHDSKGRPRPHSRKHNAEVMNALGYFNGGAGYSDAVPR